MPKKTRGLQDREFSEKCYFRWEFIRRNPIYQSDYQLFVGEFHRWFKARKVNLGEIHGFSVSFWHEFFGRAGSKSERYFADTILPYLWVFDQKWGVAWPCNPKISFDSHAYQRLLFESCDTPVVVLRSQLRPDLVLSRLTEPKKPELLDFLEIAQNLDRERQERPERYFEVLRRLGFHRTMNNTDWKRIASTRFPRGNSSQRLRLRQYPQYLTIWDFKETHPEATWPAVGRALYPEDYERSESQKEPGSTNTVVQLVKDRYRSAKDLINGGFVEIL